MSGILNNQNAGLNPEMLSQLLGMAQQDPFSRAMPGDALMGPGAMMDPGMGQGMMNPGMQQQGVPQSAFPQFPPDMGGFGLGKFAPETNEGSPLRQQMIRQLMEMIPNLGRGIGGF